MASLEGRLVIPASATMNLASDPLLFVLIPLFWLICHLVTLELTGTVAAPYWTQWVCDVSCYSFSHDFFSTDVGFR